jgi:hypothetical protein
MKSDILKQGDKLLITQEFLDNLSKRGVCHKMIWRLGETCKVSELSEFSTVKVYRGIWDVWIDNTLAENMHIDYLAKQKGFVV